MYFCSPLFCVTAGDIGTTDVAGTDGVRADTPSNVGTGGMTGFGIFVDSTLGATPEALLDGSAEGFVFADDCITLVNTT